MIAAYRRALGRVGPDLAWAKPRPRSEECLGRRLCKLRPDGDQPGRPSDGRPNMASGAPRRSTSCLLQHSDCPTSGPRTTTTGTNAKWLFLADTTLHENRGG